MLGLLANYAGGFIISKDAYEERGEAFSRQPVGFGPFQLDSIEPGVAVIFSAHEEYFRGAPKLEKVTYRFLAAAAARDLAFMAGEVDAATGIADPRWLQRTKAIAEQPSISSTRRNSRFCTSTPIRRRLTTSVCVRP